MTTLPRQWEIAR